MRGTVPVRQILDLRRFGNPERIILELNPDAALLCIDLANAFNTRSRLAISTALTLAFPLLIQGMVDSVVVQHDASMVEDLRVIGLQRKCAFEALQGLSMSA